eukprot:CAMPEP_0180504964 /NCGR_PEP_ID=MMETSP1036_2-20121128/47080_1 /TAXON_ID=632150 /ORGANISM="Azadinium spinosum, Strain 3D9" /LENGTH=50 /DNA_ID=CAMNT_0022514561 /DNA_START=396 /DNA_END=548 /DNA_ORIENTATION=+
MAALTIWGVPPMRPAFFVKASNAPGFGSTKTVRKDACGHDGIAAKVTLYA